MKGEALDRIMEVVLNLLYILLGLLKFIVRMAFCALQGVVNFIVNSARKLRLAHEQRKDVANSGGATSGTVQFDWRGRLDRLLLWVEGHGIQSLLIVVVSVWAVYKIYDNATKHKRQQFSSSTYLVNDYDFGNQGRDDFPGKRVSFRGATRKFYCPKCGHTWYAPGWPRSCPKSGCLGSPKEM